MKSKQAMDWQFHFWVYTPKKCLDTFIKKCLLECSAFPMGATGLRGAWSSPLPTLACARPLIPVYSEKGEPSDKNVTLPAVFKTLIRPDIVNFVHANLCKSNRQLYAISELAGHQTSAESWGTGRAVAQIPRVRGGGTHRSGQDGFGSMCLGGCMFAPTKTW